MEKIEVIRWLDSDGCGNSDGSGCGDSDGSGCGNSDGSGYGYGDGSGSGNSSGDGDGGGNGSGGCGNGYGDGNGDGDGYGNDGIGGGCRHEDGTGYINSNNHDDFYILGNKTDKKAGLHTFLGKRVYYIDNIPCHIYSIHNNVARAGVIDIQDMSVKDCFIGKYNNCFYHADTIRDAIEGAQQKYLCTLNVKKRNEKRNKKNNI
ncbi:MAG: hypothetical protein LBG17_01980 [Bacteroidales bacterium]|nr:hypothetical protein [Bacteroidales bacterium]